MQNPCGNSRRSEDQHAYTNSGQVDVLLLASEIALIGLARLGPLLKSNMPENDIILRERASSAEVSEQ